MNPEKILQAIQLKEQLKLTPQFTNQIFNNKMKPESNEIDFNALETIRLQNELNFYKSKQRSNMRKKSDDIKLPISAYELRQSSKRMKESAKKIFE